MHGGEQGRAAGVERGQLEAQPGRRPQGEEAALGDVARAVALLQHDAQPPLRLGTTSQSATAKCRGAHHRRTHSAAVQARQTVSGGAGSSRSIRTVPRAPRTALALGRQRRAVLRQDVSEGCAASKRSSQPRSSRSGSRRSA